MVSRGALLSVVATLTPGGVEPLPDLRGLRLEPEGHRVLRLPSNEHPDWRESAVEQAAAFVPADLAVEATEVVLQRPTRVYELNAPAGVRRVVALAGVQQAGGQPMLLRATLAVNVPEGGLASWGPAAFTGAGLDEVASRDLLVDFVDDLTAPSLAARDPDGRPATALVVGDCPKPVQDSIRRRLWCHGVRVEAHLTQPERRADVTRQRVETFVGDVLVVLERGCGGALGRLLAAANTGSAPLVLVGETEVEYLLVELDEGLDARAVDLLRLEIEAEEALPAMDWCLGTEAVAALECDHFVTTPRCLKRLPSCSYGDVDRMLDHLRRLRRLSEKWSQQQGDVGARFENWASVEAGLDIALHDQELVRKGLQRFDFDGQRYSREPHVKVDDAKAFIDCGRIYFALDTSKWRVIVDHIGLHPY